VVVGGENQWVMSLSENEVRLVSGCPQETVCCRLVYAKSVGKTIRNGYNQR
jgi:hypothetical protein